VSQSSAADQAAANKAGQYCYHCDLPVPTGIELEVEIDGQQRPMCCIGCQAVASAIVSGGLEQFYQFRNSSAETPEQKNSADHYQVYDLEDVQAEFVVASSATNELKQAQLLIGGISCAACVWLIEKHLLALPAVKKVRVNASTHRCWLEFDPNAGRLSEIFTSLDRIGFRPQPATDENQNRLLDTENRQAQRRLGIAGLGMMQVGMVAIALYGGAMLGMTEQWQGFLRITSWVFATPVVFYSAMPFYQAAWRAIKTRHLVMDVPVSIAIILAYGASIWATIISGPDVYFDSVSMFTFLLLVGRYIEMRARHRAGFAASNLAQLLPLSAIKLDAGEQHSVPVKSLAIADQILVKSGATIPCDGIVYDGRSSVDESMLTGESQALIKAKGDSVTAGTLNGESALWVEVVAVGSATRLSAIARLVAQAEQEKPQQVAIADRLAVYFVAAVLLVSASVFAYWWQVKPEDALWITLSVLVVTCPCALSLATPVALTTATNTLRRMGLLVTRGHVIEMLSQVQRVVFDKTGTLTEGAPTVVQVKSLVAGYPSDLVLALAAGLEAPSNHPIAKAFHGQDSSLIFTDLGSETAKGVRGIYQGDEYRLGSASFASQNFLSAPDDGQWLLLSKNQQALAWIELQDPLRESAAAAVKRLQQDNLQLQLLSGDNTATVGRIAQMLDIQHAQGSVTPEQKLEIIQAYQQQGDVVLMIGDGINDVPVLSGSDVSIAMPGAADLAQSHADCLLLASDLNLIGRARQLALKTRRIISQNLVWALAYNILVLPMAVMGWVPPYLAAVGMSLSSVVVVLNALRLNK